MHDEYKHLFQNPEQYSACHTFDGGLPEFTNSHQNLFMPPSLPGVTK